MTDRSTKEQLVVAALRSYRKANARFVTACAQLFESHSPATFSTKAYATAWGKIDKLRTEREDARNLLEKAVALSSPKINPKMAKTIWVLPDPFTERVVRGEDGELQWGRLSGFGKNKVFEIDTRWAQALKLPGVGSAGAEEDGDDGTVSTGPLDTE